MDERPQHEDDGEPTLEGCFAILDAMKEIAPSWKFEDLVERSHRVGLSGMNLRVLDLAAVIESKVAADRPKDRAELFVLRNTLERRSRQSLPT